MTNYSIIAEDLTKKFGKFTAVDSISFEVAQGEIFGFLGANGAGKTTAIKILTGLHSPTSGKAIVAGYDIYRETEEIKKKIGYMSQKFSLYDDLTVEENINFYGGIYGLSSSELKNKKTKLILELGLNSVKDDVLSTLPLGWKQKLAFSTAMLHNPKIIFLDEPTGGVDPITRRQFWDMIYAAADSCATIFVTTHYMDEAEYCNRLSIMVDGKISALGTPAGLKEKYNSATMDDVFIKLARGIRE